MGIDVGLFSRLAKSLGWVDISENMFNPRMFYASLKSGESGFYKSCMIFNFSSIIFQSLVQRPLSSG